MILTVTPNPAIDRIVLADKLAFEDTSSVLSTTESAGGRGLNASRVLQRFGADTLAIFPAGELSAGQMIEMLAESGFPAELVPVSGPMRTNLIITDRQGLTVKLNEPGHSLTQEELERLEGTVEQRLRGASWLLLCGSLPPGVKAEFYCRLIRLGKKHGVKTLLDTDEENLRECLEEQPTVVAPNQREAEGLVSKALILRQHFREAVERMLAMGAQSVLLTLGSRGAVGGAGGKFYEAIPPRVDAISPIGSGDAVNAAFVWATEQGAEFAEALRWGVAAGTASSLLPGIQCATREQTEKVYKKVQVRLLR